jgi:hypothetical protein
MSEPAVYVGNKLLRMEQETRVSPKYKRKKMFWPMPVIPATQEVEIRKVTICGHLGKKVHETLSQAVESPTRWHWTVTKYL